MIEQIPTSSGVRRYRLRSKTKKKVSRFLDMKLEAPKSGALKTKTGASAPKRSCFYNDKTWNRCEDKALATTMYSAWRCPHGGGAPAPYCATSAIEICACGVRGEAGRAGKFVSR
jgi:hypothetical protein